jgi:hypothetical protein
MSNPVGWVVLMRRNMRKDIFVLTALDFKDAKDAETALELTKAKIIEGLSSYRLSVFGVDLIEQRTKFNMAAAIRRLGLHTEDLNETYDSVVACLRKNAKKSAS